MAVFDNDSLKNIYLSRQIKSLKVITFGCLNVCSVIRKIYEIQTILCNSEFCYLGLTESWLNYSIADCELDIAGYDFQCYDRDLGSGKRGGGGILVYAICNRTFEQLSDWSICPPDVEWVWSIMHLPRTCPTYVCTLYCHPSGNVECFLDLLEQKVVDIYSKGTCDILIMGDVNINLLDKKNLNCRKYTNCLNILHLIQIIQSPTRVTLNSNTLIDHALINRQEMYYQSGITDVDISDHMLIYAARKKLKIPKSFSHIKCRSYTKFVEVDSQRDIERLDWSAIMDDNNVESAASNFHTILCSCVDQHAPMINLKLHDNAPRWMTRDYLSHINE